MGLGSTGGEDTSSVEESLRDRKREKSCDFFYALSNEGDAWCFWPFCLVMENPRPTAKKSKQLKLNSSSEFHPVPVNALYHPKHDETSYKEGTP